MVKEDKKQITEAKTVEIIETRDGKFKLTWEVTYWQHGRTIAVLCETREEKDELIKELPWGDFSINYITEEIEEVAI